MTQMLNAMNSQPSWWRNAKPFVNSGLSGCMGLTVMHPVDLIKVRIQLGQGSALDIVRNVMRQEGILAFYNGWSAQMARQISYGSVRLGLFQWLRDSLSPRDANGKMMPLPFYQKATIGLVSGTVAAIVGNPTDVALVRMQADKMLPLEERRNYRNVFQAIYRVGADESVAALWTGCGPTVLRAAAINASSLAVYDQTKEAVDAALGTSSGKVAVCCAATIAGVTAAASSMPFDFVKTQMQQMRPRADGTMPYTSMRDCVMQTLQSKGPQGFYVGFPVYCLRISPAVALIFFALEFIIKVEKKFGL